MISDDIAYQDQTPDIDELSAAILPEQAFLLGRINAALRCDTPFEAIIAAILPQLAQTLGASRCIVCAPRGAPPAGLVVTHEWAEPGQPTLLGQHLPPLPPELEHQRLSGAPLVSDDCLADAADALDLLTLLKLFNVRAALVANLIHSDRNLGTLEAHRAAPQPWGIAERALIQRVADYFALAAYQKALWAEEAQQRALQSAIAAIATTTATILDQEAALAYILDRLAEFVRFDSASVWLLREDMYSTIAASRGFGHSIAGTIMYLGPGSINWRAIESRAPVRIGDSSRAEGWLHSPGHETIRSWLCVPLLLNDAVVGLLTIDSHALNDFSEEDERIAQAFADQVAATVQRVRLLTEARRRAEQLQLLHQASTAIGALRTADAVTNAVGRLLHDTFGYYQVALALVEGNVLRFGGLRGHINDVADIAPTYRAYDLTRYPEGCGVTGWSVVNRQPVLSNDVFHNEHYTFIEALASSRAALAVPILSAGSALGAIYVESDQAGAFDQHDLELLETLAGQVAVALEHIRGIDTERRLNADLRAAYEQLKQAQDQLVRTEQLRVLGELASGVAHDFNNMLAGILGHAQLLLLDATDAEQRVGLHIIERAALDGAATVRRLQEFAHIRESVREPVDLARVVDESLAVTRPRWRDTLQERGIEIDVVRETAPLPLLTGDSAALRDLVTNLILNALDSMPNGGTLRLVTLPAHDLGGPTGDEEFIALPAPLYSGPAVRLEVSDSGVGMDRALLRRIFDPFFTTKGKGGTGLGLAIAQGIVQRHGGGIVVCSRPGVGSTFIVHLPAEDTPVAPQLPTPPPQVPLDGLVVLVVEDDGTVRNALLQLLERWGCVVTAVASGHEALALLDAPGAASRFQLLCTDLGLPGISGWEVLASARANAPALPTILITGWGQQLNTADAKARGADHLLAKPFDADTLRRAVAAALA